MAKKDDALFGLLMLVGIVVLLISKIFEFILDNILIISIVVFAGLLIFAMIKYFNHVDEISEKERNIQIAVLKGMKEKYEQQKRLIERSKENLLVRIQNINNDIEALKLENNSTLKVYDPVVSVSNLKNILKKQSIGNNEIWDLLYDKKEFQLINPKVEFDKQIKNLDFINEPIYFELINYSSIKEKNQKVLIEKKKEEYNHNLKSIFDSSNKTINERITELAQKYKYSEGTWTSEFEKFKNDKKQKNDDINL